MCALACQPNQLTVPPSPELQLSSALGRGLSTGAQRVVAQRMLKRGAKNELLAPACAHAILAAVHLAWPAAQSGCPRACASGATSSRAGAEDAGRWQQLPREQRPCPQYETVPHTMPDRPLYAAPARGAPTCLGPCLPPCMPAFLQRPAARAASFAALYISLPSTTCFFLPEPSPHAAQAPRLRPTCSPALYLAPMFGQACCSPSSTVMHLPCLCGLTPLKLPRRASEMGQAGEREIAEAGAGGSRGPGSALPESTERARASSV